MRAIGLRLDRSGTFWHQGTAVTHPRLRQALLRWLDVRDDGRDLVRLDEKRYAYVEVEDAHLPGARGAVGWNACIVHWDDDTESELDYGSLRQAADHALYAAVRGRLRGRIAGPAYHTSPSGSSKPPSKARSKPRRLRARRRRAALADRRRRVTRPALRAG